jgi:hypothetical protein
MSSHPIRAFVNGILTLHERASRPPGNTARPGHHHRNGAEVAHHYKLQHLLNIETYFCNP